VRHCRGIASGATPFAAFVTGGNLIFSSAQYGSEDILRYIYEQSGAKWRIHVDSRKFGDYLCSDGLGDCTDSDPNHAQWIHACSWDSWGEKKRPKKSKQFYLREIPCQSGKPFEVCQIRPSAMYFSKEKMGELDDNKVMRHVGGQFYRVCYSCHSSLTELLEFCRYFKPKKVVPCALPRGMSSDDVRLFLTDLLHFIFKQTS
jgi:hypothetical protein